MIKIKICGLRDEQSIVAAVEGQADYIGFVFVDKSPRNITPEQVSDLQEYIPSNIKKVAVLVSPSDDKIDSILQHFTPDYLQLHGGESAQRVKEIRSKYSISIIKAISVDKKIDLDKAFEYQDVADIILFDAKPPKTSDIEGGNGISFDWGLLNGYQSKTPWILSGGLNSNNILDAIAKTGAKIIDASSGVEDSYGVKNPVLIKEFLKKLHECE